MLGFAVPQVEPNTPTRAKGRAHSEPFLPAHIHGLGRGHTCGVGWWVQVKLSSAAVPDEKASDTIVIGPPLYLELHLGGATHA